MRLLIFLISGIFGFITASFIAGKKGRKGIIAPIIFRIKDYKIHLHHWLISTIILIILMFLNFYNDVIYGFLTGLIIQGLTYKDFYRIISRTTD